MIDAILLVLGLYLVLAGPFVIAFHVAGWVARPRGVGASSSPLVPVTRSAQVDDGGDEMDNLGDWLGMREVLTEEFKKRLLELNENDDI